MAQSVPGVTKRTQPRVFVRTKTLSRSVAGNAGPRLLCIVGEGEAEETIVQSAQGGGDDGVNSDFSGSNSPDGRHFELLKTDLVQNRVKLYKNGSLLRILEQDIDTEPFDARYDARVEVSTGRIQLQQAYLVNQGFSGATAQYWASPTTNVGNGQPNLESTSLVNTAAPAETWTLRCISVIRDGSGDIIPGKAIFSLTGSVSGAVKDDNGNPIRWRSDGVTVSNEFLSFDITEGSEPFDVGDRFTITVESGVLAKNDNLVARYIANEDINDPEIFSSGTELFAKHGEPSTENTLSLAAQIAFENGASRVLALQAKPPVPRKTSVTLLAADDPLSVAEEGASGNTESEDCIFPLPLGALPDVDTEVQIFVVDPDGTEEQLVLSKEAFYDYDSVSTAYSTFVTGSFSQSYTVFSAPEVEQSSSDADGYDGYILTLNGTSFQLDSENGNFSADLLDAGEDDTLKQLQILFPPEMAGNYTITGIGDGYGDNSVLTLSGAHSGGTGIGYEYVRWRLIDPSDTSAYLALTDDIVENYLTAGKGLRIAYIDTKDADFFDTNWGQALEELETVDLQVLVPVPSATASNIFQAAKVHVETMSNIVNARERMLVIGALSGLLPENLTGAEDAAVEDIGIIEGIQGDDTEEVLEGNIEDLANYSVPEAYGDSFRVVYMAPDQIIRTINGTNTVLSGMYLAAAMGGFLASQTDFAQPPTFKTLAGFTISRDRQYRQATLDELADAGVCVVQPVSGGGRILHGLTTTQSGAAEEEEISIVFIRDIAASALRNAVNPFIGTVSSPTTIPSITSAVKNTLEGLVSQGLLTGFANLQVKRNPNEPRQYDISVTIAPATPINWVFVDVTVTV